MRVIDVQVHTYERSHPGRPWVGAKAHGPDSADGQEMVAAMREAGVDAAILVSAYSLYRFDPSYAMEVYRRYPDRFRVVKPVNVTDPAMDELVADWAGTRGAVGIRVMLRNELLSDPADPRVSRPFQAAARHGLPVNFLCWGRLDDGAEVVRRNPDTVIVIDHLGLLQPNHPPPPAEPWADLPKLLALAAYPNVRVKISGACTLSLQPYPYGDIWDPVLRVIDAFGIDRCMWGTDWTRTIGMLTYRQATAPFLETTRLSDSDKARLMGGTLETVYHWNER
ncbi:amidohydrolase family protein [Rhodopila sp.]|jgi:predicted TIM-barrel fold metal-dependent hydrolase|uniref:amidohydrolase family protein n=1 Tax=Rhodopila sp. TaxID=2480087 RepID=UPI002BFC402D|nr:amidohydrolase family protein [Rhodopila sp.]HVZ06491.1 amidohydrolase family protein [Rhodopila sp.]